MQILRLSPRNSVGGAPQSVGVRTSDVKALTDREHKAFAIKKKRQIAVVVTVY